jgi:hypothetical protein
MGLGLERVCQQRKPVHTVLLGARPPGKRVGARTHTQHTPHARARTHTRAHAPCFTRPLTAPHCVYGKLRFEKKTVAAQAEGKVHSVLHATG